MLPLRRIVAPPEGAGAVSVTVPVVVPPPAMLAEASDSDASAAGVAVPGGATVSHNDGERYDSAPYPESIRMRVAAATGEVVMLKDAPVPPAGMKTVGGSDTTAGSALTSVTTAPPEGAGFMRVTVPVVALPPTTVSAPSECPHRSGNNPSELICQLVPTAARSVPTAAAPTGDVVIGATIASVAPAGMKTLAGVSTPAMSLATFTVMPPAGAGWVNVTRAWVALPPETDDGVALNDNTPRPCGTGGPATMVNVPVADQGPGTWPCTVRTRQK